MKKLISISTMVLIVCLVSVLLISGSTLKAEALTEGDYTYTVSNGEATITKYNGSGGDVVIPNTLGGYPVTTIGVSAFDSCDSLTSVTIPDSVTTIGISAFRSCDSLTSVTIPDSVTTIGEWAFYYCTSLTSVTIPDSVTTIGDYAFYSCSSLTSVYITDIASWCNIDFCNCYSNPLYNAEKLYLKGSGTPITDLVIPDSVTTIGDSAFYSCDSLTSVTIPDSVTTIGDSAFNNCTGLTSVTIGDSVTTIGDYAFHNCDSLTSVTIPDSVTTIGDYAFYFCDSLTSVYITDIASWCNIDFGNNYSNPLYYAKKLYLKGNITPITDLVIPDSVTTIGNYAFRYCTSLTSVTVPDSVTTIGYEAFSSCDSLTSVTIGDSVTIIGDRAFYSCSSLTSIEVNSNNIYYSSQDGILFNKAKTTLIQYPIGKTATSYTIPDSVTTIGEWAFSSCDSLTSVTIGDSVTTIGDGAFYYCRSLTSVTIPDSVTSIGDYAFFYCDSLTSVTIGDSVTTIGEWAFSSCDSLTSVTIGDSVTTIGDYAFSSCDSLTSVTIPDSVTTIGYQAFYFCDSLKDVWYEGESQDEIDISEANFCFTSATWHYNSCMNNPDGWTHSGADAAYCTYCNPCEHTYKWVIDVEPTATTNGYKHEECTACGATRNENTIIEATGGDVTNDFTYEIVNGEAKITKYNGSGGGVVIPNTLGVYPVTTIGDYAFYDCTSLTSVTIGDSVTTIGEYAFSYCSSLTNVTIGDSVTTIGDYAFYDCTSLTSVTIGDSVTTIGLQAFSNCTSLTNVTIGDSVTTIGDEAFCSCDSLTSVTIGDSVTTIGHWAFNYCSSLTSIEVNSNNVYYSSQDGILFNKAKTTLIKYPIGKTTTSYTIPDSVTTIGLQAFSNCTSLTSVTIPDSVTTIGHWAFNYCSSLTSVTIGDSVTSIGNYAFCGCTSLTSVTIGDSVTSIGSHAFSSCTSLTSVTIPDSVTTIGLQAFSNCISLTSVTIGDSVTSISDDAFSYCKNLTSIEVNSNNVYYSSQDGILFNKAKTTLIKYPIGKTATSYTIPDSVTSIGDYAFDGCKSLTSVTIPDSVTSIGNYVFYNCSGLTSVTIGDSVTTIGNRAFSSCTSLTSVTIPDSVTSIGDSAFYKCDSLTSVTIGDSVTTIGEWAFSSCTSLTSVTIPDSVTSIGYRAFYSCSSLKDVWYEGESQDEIDISEGNSRFTSATWHYNSCIKNTETYEHTYKWVIDVEPTATTNGYKHEECTACGATRNENTVIEAFGEAKVEIIGTDIVKKGDTIVLTVTLSDCANGTSYGIEVNFGDKLELIEGIMGRTDGMFKFDIATNKGSYAYTNGVTDLNGTVLTLTFKGGEASTAAEEISVHLMARNGSVNLYDGTVTKTVKVICDVHNFSAWEQITAATCVTAGEEKRVCSVCGEVETKTIEATGIHIFDSEDDEQCNTCDYVRYVAGDIDGDDKITDADAIYLLLHTYFPETYPVDQPVDYDGNGSIDDQDAIHLLFYTYFPEDYPIPEAPKYIIVYIPNGDEIIPDWDDEDFD